MPYASRARKSDWPSTDVQWTVPGHKTPIAYSTVSVSDSIGAMADDHPTDTVSELQQRFTYGPDERKVLQVYIDAGFGGTVASSMFSYSGKHGSANAQNDGNQSDTMQPATAIQQPEASHKASQVSDQDALIYAALKTDSKGDAYQIAEGMRNGYVTINDENIKMLRDAMPKENALQHDEDIGTIESVGGGVNERREAGSLQVGRRLRIGKVPSERRYDKDEKTVRNVLSAGKGNGNFGGDNKHVLHFKDNEGKIVSQDIIERLRDSEIMSSENEPIAVYHFTENIHFTNFKYGDIGFHFGTYKTALGRKEGILKEREITTERVIRAYLNITHPIFIDADIMSWQAIPTAMRCYADGIISHDQYMQVHALRSSGSGYSSPASKLFREMLGDLGYDGIIYQNTQEEEPGKTSDSYIAFSDDQVIIVDADYKEGKPNAENEKRVDITATSESAASGTSGGGVLERVLPAVVPGADGGGPGSGAGVLSDAGRESVQRPGGSDAAGAGGGSSLGDREGVSVSEGRGEHEVTKPKNDAAHETAQKTEQALTDSSKGNNFVIGEKLSLPKGEKARFKANVEAIRIVKSIIKENRFATAEEQQALSQYVGWGGLSSAFDAKNEKWAKEFAQLKGELSEAEYNAARSSTLNAHYTSVDVIRAMYTGLQGMGFAGGRMLEPSGGIGHFMGAMPPEMQSQVRSWTMVELDDITGSIAKYLYPNNDVRVQGFETARIPDNYMDVAIGNVPFGNYPITDTSYPKQVTSSIHNYFFAKSLDKVRPGGLVMFITSRYTLDSYDDSVRKYMMDRADLVGAIRLPNTAFADNAGTQVVTDIVVLQKRAASTPYNGEKFVGTTYSNGAQINTYFAAHPEMILGTPRRENGMYGRNEITYDPLKGDLKKQIEKAFAQIKRKIDYPARPTAEEATRETIKASKGNKEGQMSSQNGKIVKVVNGELVEQGFTDRNAKIATRMFSLRDAARGLLNMQLQGDPESSIKASGY